MLLTTVIGVDGGDENTVVKESNCWREEGVGDSGDDGHLKFRDGSIILDEEDAIGSDNDEEPA